MSKTPIGRLQPLRNPQCGIRGHPSYPRVKTLCVHFLYSALRCPPTTPVLSLREFFWISRPWLQCKGPHPKPLHRNLGFHSSFHWMQRCWASALALKLVTVACCSALVCMSSHWPMVQLASGDRKGAQLVKPRHLPEGFTVGSVVTWLRLVRSIPVCCGSCMVWCMSALP